jgi:hypothetical protein
MRAFRRLLIFVHRYLGIALCLLFTMWFGSGIAMIYARDMPRLTPAVRLQRLPALDVGRVGFTPAQAAARAGLRGTPRLTLLTILDRPAYRFSGRTPTTVFADTGDLLADVGERDSLAIAGRFVNQPPASLHYLRALDRADQWTIAQRRELPLHKIAADDAERTELYVSARLGEVVVQTTRGTRALAWIAAIPHWLYFAPLRLNDGLWRQVILSTSGLGVVSALAGLILAVTQFRVRYSGLYWWHYLFGAVVGVFALTWVFSGLLSMEPWYWASSDGGPSDIPRALSGGSLDVSAFPPIDPARLREAAPDGVKEIDFRRIQDELFYVIRGASSRPALVTAGSLEPRRQPFSIDSIVRRVKAAEPDTAIAASELLSDYDAYYYDRDRAAPLPVLRIKLDDPDRTWIYVDPALSEIVGTMTRRERLQRWLYHGLHSLDFPFWYYRRPLWDAGVIALCAGGAVSSLLGVVLGWRRMRRAVTRL